MRIVDVCAFYTPAGGGVRTYLENKLKEAPRLGHEMILLAPGERDEVVHRGPGAMLATIAAPTLPVDRRYRYFDDQAALHRALDRWRPDHVEASSPWSSATMVGRWQGAASRSLVMHADPLAAYAYRWFGRVASIATIDRWFSSFWAHLRGLDRMFDLVVCANQTLTDRLAAGGLRKAVTIRMGSEAGRFSPRHRSEYLRQSLLDRLGLPADAVVLLGLGRFSAEKRWPMVIHAAQKAGRVRPVGLVLVGDGPDSPGLIRLARDISNVAVLERVDQRDELARLIASVDGLVHGCEAETFCMVAAEARASGVPLLVPDRGGAYDQLLAGAGAPYRAGSTPSLAEAIVAFVDRGAALQRARALSHTDVRTMDGHFAELFAAYEALGEGRRGFGADLPSITAGQAISR
ncbi:MAG: glycosyltransferase [Sphingomicrobium sp.]